MAVRGRQREDRLIVRWPGVDKKRALAACWHFMRAAEWLSGLRELDGRPISDAGALALATHHAIQGRGYLGAIGFEEGARL